VGRENRRFHGLMTHAGIAEVWASFVTTANAKKRPQSLREQEANKLAAEVLHHLRLAKANGHFQSPVWRQLFDRNPWLAALRDRPDFKAFVASLDKP
jgi:hypothetical protein